MSVSKLLDPITPCEVLCEDFMEPLGISINQLSRDLSVPPNRISEIVNGKRSITADTALRLQRYFGVEAQFWLNLQMEYDLRMMKRKIWSDFEGKGMLPNDSGNDPKSGKLSAEMGGRFRPELVAGLNRNG